MSDSIGLVIFGSQEQANESAKGVLVPFTRMDTVENFKLHLCDRRQLIFIILLFINSSNPIFHSVLEELERRRCPKYVAFRCGDDPTNNSMDIPFVSESLLPYKLTSTFARFLDEEFIKQCNLGNLGLGANLYQQRTKMLEHSEPKDKLHACHILFIPLNATLKDVQIVQQHMKCICYELYGNEYEFKIDTLFDHITEDEQNLNDESYTDYLKKRYKGDVCRTIMDSALIRMYVVGNEPRILNTCCEKLVAAEADINEEHTLKYVDRCTFITKERLENRFAHDLVPLFGRHWNIRRAFAKTLDEVRNDIYFHDILPRIHGCLKNREMIINCESHEQPSGNSQVSSQIRSTGQAQNGPVETQIAVDIKNKILSTQQ